MAMNNRKMNVKRSNPKERSLYGLLGEKNQKRANHLLNRKLLEELESRPKGRPKRMPPTTRPIRKKKRFATAKGGKMTAKGGKMAMMGGGKVMNPGMMALKKEAPEVAKRMGYMYGGKVKKMMGGGKVMKYSTGGMGMKNKKFNPKCDGQVTQGRTRGTIVT